MCSPAFTSTSATPGIGLGTRAGVGGAGEVLAAFSAFVAVVFGLGNGLGWGEH